MVKIFNEAAHLQNFVRPDFTVDEDAFFELRHSNQMKIATYTRKIIKECIEELKISRNISCKANVHRSTVQWGIACLLKSYNFKQEYAKLEDNKELVARGLELNITCRKKDVSIVIDELLEKFFSKVNLDYPIYPLSMRYFDFSDCVIVDFVIIYPRARYEKYYRLPPYNPDSFEWPDYNERFELALNELGIKWPQRETRQLINDIITTWNNEWGINKRYLHPKYIPDRWFMNIDGYSNEGNCQRYYMRGSKEEIEGLKYLIQYGYCCFQNVCANDYEYEYNEEKFCELRLNYPRDEERNNHKKEITDSDEQFEMGLDFEMSKDGEKASYWYHKSAEQGNLKGMFNLAYLYYFGELVEKNYDISLKWFTKSADLDDSGWADFYLGEMYANGYGAAQDFDKARYWYIRAADKGHDDALKTIKKLDIDYNDSKYKQKKEHEEKLRRIEEEKKKLIEIDAKEREKREKELEIISGYLNVLKYLNSEEYSQPDYEIDLSAFYTSKHAEGKPNIGDIVTECFNKCCDSAGLFNDEETRYHCTLDVDEVGTYFNTPRLLKKIELTKKYNKIDCDDKLVIKTFYLDIDMDGCNPADFPKAKDAISFFFKEINKDYPCFIERYSKYTNNWFVEDFKNEGRIVVLVGIVYPAEYEKKPFILPIENQTIETIDSKKLIETCVSELVSNPEERKKLLEINNIKGTRTITKSKTERTTDQYKGLLSLDKRLEGKYLYSDRGCLEDDKNNIISYFMRGTIEEKIAIKTSLFIGYRISSVEHRNAKIFDFQMLYDELE